MLIHTIPFLKTFCGKFTYGAIALSEHNKLQIKWNKVSMSFHSSGYRKQDVEALVNRCLNPHPKPEKNDNHKSGKKST